MAYKYTVSLDGKEISTRDVSAVDAQKLVGATEGKVTYSMGGHTETHEVKRR
jgi:hypothetical protein